MTDRAVILIDGGYFDNINAWAEHKYNAEIDIQQFSKELCDTFNVSLLRSKFYHASPYRDGEEDYESRQRYFDAIDNLPNHQFERTGRMREEHFSCSECGEDFEKPKQKGVDVGIAVDLVAMAHQNQSDAFILVSGGRRSHPCS